MRILNGYAQVVSTHVFFNAYNLHLLVCVSGLEFQASNKKDLYCAQVICNTYMYMYCMFSFCMHVHIHVHVWGELASHKRSSTHCPSSQGWASGVLLQSMYVVSCMYWLVC